MGDYFLDIWRIRHFWIHLALSDLRARWRRSFFGVLWSLLQPLGMSALIGVVFSQMFKSDITTYMPYILSGLIIWDFIASNVTAGCLAFFQADAYIKQYRHPLAIYTLRNVVSGIVVLMLACVPLYVWAAIVLPEKIGLSWLATFSIFPMLVIIVWPLATIMAYIGTRFRDIAHASGLIMQAIWFVSPVYFDESMFRRGNLSVLVDWNPVYHILQIVRAPLLTGAWPALVNYQFAFGMAVTLTFIAAFVGWRSERKVIFYL